jgi:hypothetical protein
LLFAPGSVAPLGALSVEAIAAGGSAFRGSYLDFGVQLRALVTGPIAGRAVTFGGVLSEPLLDPAAAFFTGFPAPPPSGPVPQTANSLVRFTGFLTSAGVLQGQLTASQGEQLVTSQ